MKAVARGLDTILLLMSPIAILFFLLAALLLAVETSEQRGYRNMLLEAGQIAQATVDHVYEDGDLHVVFVDAAGGERFAILRTVYYPSAVRAALQEGTVQTIRYLPPYAEGPVLEDHLDTVLRYRKPLTGLWVMLAVSWAILILRPDFLYFGYVKDLDALMRRDFAALDLGERS
ncbi:MAG: hypothetical protein KDD84_14780 [Caldilineaceae bacterium]|nr:hypothetical protein [Caldilineaceae bacterium]